LPFTLVLVVPLPGLGHQVEEVLQLEGLVLLLEPVVGPLLLGLGLKLLLGLGFDLLPLELAVGPLRRELAVGLQLLEPVFVLLPLELAVDPQPLEFDLPLLERVFVLLLLGRASDLPLQGLAVGPPPRKLAVDPQLLERAFVLLPLVRVSDLLLQGLAVDPLPRELAFGPLLQVLEGQDQRLVQGVLQGELPFDLPALFRQ